MEPACSLPHLQVPAPPVHNLSPLNPVHTYTSHLMKIRLNIILPSTPGSPKRSLPPVFSTKTLYTPLLSSMRATYLAHLNLLEFITRKILGDQYRLLSSSLCNFLHSPVTWSLLCPNILSTLFSYTLSLRSSLNVIDQVSHPYKKTGKTYSYVYLKL